MIREATIDDAKAITKVRVDTWKTAYKGIMEQDYLNNIDYNEVEERIRNYILRRHEEKTKHIFVYQENDKSDIIGFIQFASIPINDTEFDSEVLAFYVFDEYQGMGIGRRLFDGAIQTIREESPNAKTVLIWGVKDNLHGRKFYEKNGGIIVKSKVVKLGNMDIDGVAYRIEL